jgi:hypothetical protein
MTAMVLDTGERAAHHRRSFAGGLTVPTRRIRPSSRASESGAGSGTDVDVEIRPLSRYDALIPT